MTRAHEVGGGHAREDASRHTDSVADLGERNPCDPEPTDETGNRTHLAALFSEYEAGIEMTVVPQGTYELEVVSVKVHDTEIVPVYRVVSGRWIGARVAAGHLDRSALIHIIGGGDHEA